MDEPLDRKMNNSFVMKLLKECSIFLLAKDVRLSEKLFNLNELYVMWSTDTDEGKLF
jgi:hypothetical protein